MTPLERATFWVPSSRICLGRCSMALLFRRRVMLSYVVIRCVSVSMPHRSVKICGAARAEGFSEAYCGSLGAQITESRLDANFSKTQVKNVKVKSTMKPKQCAAACNSNAGAIDLTTFFAAVCMLSTCFCASFGLESVRDKQNPIKTSGINAINRIAPQPASTIETHLFAFHTELHRASHNPPIRTLQYRAIKDLCPS